jgi:hypothetical protein
MPCHDDDELESACEGNDVALKANNNKQPNADLFFNQLCYYHHRNYKILSITLQRQKQYTRYKRIANKKYTKKTMPSPPQSSRHQTPIRLIIQLCLLLTNFTIISSLSCGKKSPLRRPTTSSLLPTPRSCNRRSTTQQQHNNHGAAPLLLRQWQTVLFSASYDDDDDILDDLMSNDDATTRSREMYTQGGVIMPEGGANPCVIKVR